ncbi:MAG: ABC transporter ATP-binding protein [Eggerthellaceae bacterium]|nr:ABC transporter ATP-binding protein [Eggerthellaceae bacterium]
MIQKFITSFKRKYALTDSGFSNFKKATFWTIVVNLVVMSSMSILYFLMDAFMDTYSHGSELPNPWIFIAAVVVFVGFSLAAHYQQYVNTYGLVYQEVKRARIGLAESLRKMPLAFFGKRDVADLTDTILGDLSRMEHVWSHVLGYLQGSYVSTIIVAVMLFIFDWRLAFASLWGVPVAFALLFGSHEYSRRHAHATKKASLDVADHIQETLDHMREIRSINKQDEFLNEFSSKVISLEKQKVREELFTGIFVNAASVIMRLGVATTILVGGILIAKGSITFMTFFMFLLVVTRIYAPFDQSLALIAEVFFSEVSAARLQELYDIHIDEGTTNFEPSNYDIEFKNVSFSYEKDSQGSEKGHSLRVIDDVSFVARQGEVTALVGASGSGKSTLARLAARLWEADAGSITVGGIDIAGIDHETLLRDYAIVFQDVMLFDNSVMENIRIGKHNATDEEVKAAARLALCDEFVEKLPHGYDTFIGENGARLSGGERQRISIARALLKDAPIVILDEATASLDVENETRVQQALSHLLKNKTVLVIAHRMRTVENADHIVVLNEGKIIEEGNPHELVKHEDGVFAHMLSLQKQSAAWSI